ncbi:MAG: precorrin-6y C5,15-methyltransferase (decarboxylating) subunit CbiE [Pseudomonadales bacterium]|nr:precorrin-6y C5,15-methyltransferase (decarboxylating) subunit CbiE [Pseudomonadales bacterium]
MIHIIGLGVSEKAELSSSAQEALLGSSVVVGSQRQIEVVRSLFSEKTDVEFVVLPKLAQLKALIEQHAEKEIAVLASGDPLFYGIGRWFGKSFEAEHLSFYPAVSSVQAACHSVGWSLQDVDVLSLHGRSLDKIRTRLKSNSRLAILTDKNSQPEDLAEECWLAGFEQSRIWVCENLGYQQEKIREFSVVELLEDEFEFDALHVTLIETKGMGGFLPNFPGIPDQHFITGEVPGKGMISKREVRLQILSLMQPANDDVIWDIGAGCGGVAVELAYWNERVAVHAIEFHSQRLTYLNQNRQRFGVVSNLHIVQGRAPDCLGDLPLPNKVFIGGSDGELNTLLNQVWQMLPENGVLVASAVMASTKKQLQDFALTLSAKQVECVELAVKRGTLNEQGELEMQGKLPVEIFKFTKTGGL